MLGFLKKIFHKGDDLDLDIDSLSSESHHKLDNNLFTQQQTPTNNINMIQPPQIQQMRSPQSGEGYITPQAFLPPQSPSIEDPVRQQIEVLQSKIDMLNSKLDLILQKIQMLEQYFYYRR